MLGTISNLSPCPPRPPWRAFPTAPRCSARAPSRTFYRGRSIPDLPRLPRGSAAARGARSRSEEDGLGQVSAGRAFSFSPFGSTHPLSQYVLSPLLSAGAAWRASGPPRSSIAGKWTPTATELDVAASLSPLFHFLMFQNKVKCCPIFNYSFCLHTYRC
jgi:hypothetical protein